MLKRGLAFGGILAILSGVGIYNNIYAAETGTTKFSVDVNNAVLELTVPASPAVIDLNPTMTNASFGSTSINVHVATNNQTGYTLTMTPTNNQTATSLIRTELIEDEQNYREIETLELTDPISTGYTEQTFTANSWGYKITGDNYYGIDPENTTVSHPAWTTSEPTNGTNHNLTLAAKVDADTVSGAYETTLNFRAVTNAVVAKHTISFNANGGTGTMNDITVTAGNSTTLPANTFTPPTGMKFIGWSTTQNGQGQGIRYYDDEATYTATDIGYNVNLTLYAIWANENFPSSTTPAGVTGTTISRAYEIAYTAAGKGMWERDEGDRDNDGDTNEYYQVQDGVYHNYDVRWDMQGMTPEICNSVTVMEDDYQAIDVRDWKLYHITKLLDGYCWMTQDLDLDLSTEIPLNHSDSDIGWTVFDENASWTPERSTSGYTIIDSSYSLRLSAWKTSDTIPYSADIGNFYRDGEKMISIDECVNRNNTQSFCEHKKSGNIYNWTAMIASNDSSSLTTEYTIAPNSICPAGWRLLRSNDGADNDNDDLTRIKNVYGSNALKESSRLYWSFSGGVAIGSTAFSTLGNMAKYYHTATIHKDYDNAKRVFGLYWSTGNINGNLRYTGSFVRCIAR